MTKAELKQQLEEQQKIIERQKNRVKNQNERAKQNWDTVSCRLPKGTKERITNQGFTVNGFINTLVLKRLKQLEK
jgi:hypothetical protein